MKQSFKSVTPQTEIFPYLNAYDSLRLVWGGRFYGQGYYFRWIRFY
jgi:hypothetical protein